MGLTLQILTKTYCCNDSADRNTFNEDLESEGSNNNNDEEEEKLLVKSVSSFHTEMND